MFEYQVIIYTESAVTALLPGGGRVDPERFAAFINGHARRGWKVVTMEREKRRTLLFWSREAFLVVMERPLQRAAGALSEADRNDGVRALAARSY